MTGNSYELYTKMKVAFVFTHVSHGSPGSFERVRHLCTHLNTQGIECTILTPYEEDKAGISDVPVQVIPSIINSMNLSSLSYSVFRKLSSSRLGSKIFLSEIALRQMTKNLAKGISKSIMKNKFDIIHAVQPVAAVACTLIDRSNISMVTDLHNIWSEELVLYDIIKKDDPIFSRLRRMEQNIINSSDSLTVVSDTMKSYILKNYSASANSIVVLPPAGYITDLELERERNVVYAGMVSAREHVDLFAKSIQFVKGQASFHISNYGDDLGRIKKLTEKSGHPRVLYSWFKSRPELITFLHKSRIGIVTSKNDICRQLGPALKLFEYISCGLPIVANDIGGWTQIIEDEKIGILTHDDPQEFAKAIDLLLEDNQLWNTLHENALRLVRTKQNWESNVKKILIPAYEKLLSK